MKKEPKGTGFSTPAIGDVYPKGTRIKKNPDGTISLIVPKSTPAKEKTPATKKKAK